MMSGSIYKKGLIFGIIVILIGTGIISATRINLKQEDINFEEKQLYQDPFNYNIFHPKIKFIFNMGQYVQQTADNGYIVTGFKGETDTNEPNSSSNVITILMKYDVNGNKQWGKTFELIGGNMGFSVQQTGDNGYIIGGSILFSF